MVPNDEFCQSLSYANLRLEVSSNIHFIFAFRKDKEVPGSIDIHAYRPVYEHDHFLLLSLFDLFVSLILYKLDTNFPF